MNQFKNYILFLAFLFTLQSFALSPVQKSKFKKLSAYDIIKKGEDIMRGTSSYSRSKITVEKRRFKRSMVIDNWDSSLGKKTFIRILKPKKDKGVTFLKKDKKLWQYIPGIGKEIKIEESLMGDSWMGSDFTNDDLVRETSITDDYTHAFSTSNDPSVYRIILKPKPGKPVIWEKIVMYIRKKDYLPQKEEFFDHKNRLQKRLILSDFRDMGKRFIPTRLEMSTIKQGKVRSSTTMEYIRIKFDLNIPSRIFSKANLRK